MLATLKTLNKPAARAYAAIFPHNPAASHISLVYKTKKTSALNDNVEYDPRLITEITARKYAIAGALVEGAWLWAILRHCITHFKVADSHMRMWLAHLTT